MRRLLCILLARLSSACAAAVAWCICWFATSKKHRAITAAARRYKLDASENRQQLSDCLTRYEELEHTITLQSSQIEILTAQLSMYADWEEKTRERLAAETAEYAARKVAAMGGVQSDREEI